MRDLECAIALARQALSIMNALPQTSDRSTTHATLALLLRDQGDLDAGARHALAELVYTVVSGRGLNFTLHNLRVALKRHPDAVPFARLAELLADPEFAPVRDFLDERQIDTEALQGEIDRLVAHVKASLTQQAPKPPEEVP
jgi:hypothetical protein